MWKDPKNREVQIIEPSKVVARVEPDSPGKNNPVN